VDADTPIVRIGTGLVRGRSEDGIAVFRGMPYAAPPVAEHRFAAPADPRPWDGTRDAALFGPPPPQSQALPLLLEPADPAIGPDDWLTVNVWSPSLGAAGLPVMVWIHGGAYRLGTAAQASYNGSELARRGVVVVTFNYRVAVEGFTQIPGMPPNRGLLDQVAALRWVRDNIAGFGGDPANVTLFGESAGAGSIAALLVMPSAKGLFGRAIAQSVPGLFFTRALADAIGAELAREAGRPLADVDPADLAVVGDKVRPPHHRDWGLAAHSDTAFAPVIDGEVLPSTPWRALATGTAREIDLITGANKDESRLFLELGGLRGTITDAQAARLLDAILPDGDNRYRIAFSRASAEERYETGFTDWMFRVPVLHLAQTHAAAGGRTFLYDLSYQGGTMGACHGLDIPLVFGVYREMGQFVLGSPPPESAVALGDLMRTEWVAFATSGDPGWPPYAPGRRQTRIYDEQPTVASYPHPASMHLWDQQRLAPYDLLR